MFSFAKILKDKLENGRPGHGSTESDSYFHSNLHINNCGHALRVLHVYPNSTASQHHFEAWFDYIVGINNHDLPMKNPNFSSSAYAVKDDGSFAYGGEVFSEEAAAVDFDLLAQELASIANGPNKTATFEVWSAKGGIMRTVTLPLEPYSEGDEIGENSLPLFKSCFKMIGLTVKSQHVNTATHVWKILKTHPGSPAFQAQLVPHSDYIIGCDSAFPSDPNGKGLLLGGGEQLLSKTISSYYNFHQMNLNDDRIPIILYVYNHDYDVLRHVTVHLSRSWAPGSNRGALGCDVGYGLLHRLPEVIGKFNSSHEKIDDILFHNPNEIAYIPHDQIAPSIETSSTSLGSPETVRKHSTKYVPASPKGVKHLNESRAENAPKQHVESIQESLPETEVMINSTIVSPISSTKEIETEHISGEDGTPLLEKSSISVAEEVVNHVREAAPRETVETENILGSSISEKLDELPTFDNDFLTSDHQTNEGATEQYELVDDSLILNKDVPSEPLNESIFLDQEKSSERSPYEMNKIEAVLDEDFLSTPQESKLTQQDLKENTSVKLDSLNTKMCEISLEDDIPTRNISEATQPGVPHTVQPAVQPAVQPTLQPSLLPNKPSSAGNSPSSGKTGRRRRTHGPSNINVLTDFMNEELSRSKANDIRYDVPGEDSNLAPPPPPPSKSLRH